jgi:NADH dehydrogenase
MDDILVLGATGFVGLAVCEKLVERTGGADERITVTTRHVQHAMHLMPLPPVEIVQWHPDDDAELARLVHGRDAVVNLIGILHGGEADFQRVHARLPERLARACARAGVPRLLHVSALGADAQAPSMYLRSKAAGEEAVLREFPDATLLRPSVIFGEGDRFMNRFAELQGIAPVLPLPCADARFQPVWVDDVAAGVVAALERRHGGIVECVGPRVYTLRELVRLAGEWSGHPRPVIAMPDALARLQAALMQVLPGDPPLSSDNLRSMEVPSVATGQHPTLSALGIEPRALEAVMPAVLSARGGPTRRDTLRTLAHR